MKHIVMYSGGIASWLAAKRVVAEHGPADVTLLFADTRMEDDDLYRWLLESADNVGAELVTIEDGRDPWQVFHDVRFLGNTRADPCSRILKRELISKWLTGHCDPEDTTLYIGIHKSEEDRFERTRVRQLPWVMRAPLCEPPVLAGGTAALLHAAQAEGLEPPALYALGFHHNNCGGFCIKAGHTQFALLLRTRPGLYGYHEEQERRFRRAIGKNVTILRDRRGGTTKPLTLQAFRERIEGGAQVSLFDWGACSCFAEAE